MVVLIHCTVHCTGLHCYRQVRLADIESVAVEERRGYLTLVITAQRDLKLLLRRTEGIREWAASLEVHWRRERANRNQIQMKSTDDFWNRKQFSDSHGFQDWLLARENIG